MPNEPYVDIRVNTRSGDEVKQKLMEIANAARAFSPTERGQLEYINRYLFENGRTIIPLRFVAEASGATVNWDGANRTAVIRR